MLDLSMYAFAIFLSLALIQLNIIMFGVIKRAIESKAILGDREIIVLPSDSAEEAVVEAETTEETEETEAASEDIEVLAAQLATLAAEIAKKKA